MRGSLHCAIDGETVHGFGRDDTVVGTLAEARTTTTTTATITTTANAKTTATATADVAGKRSG
jgi:hypothetical protein